MFSKLGLAPALTAPLARLGYEAPTPIQLKAIPLVLSGIDVLARAQTGTGKTAAFGLPVIDRFLRSASSAGRQRPRGLVLVPTRELAAQVHRALSTYGAPMNARVTAIFGGVSMGGQIHALQRGTDIIVATPGRLIDHVQRKTVDLSTIEVLVLDEADRMLDMGFLPALRRILAVLPRQRQTLLFSATLADDVIRLAADFTRNPARVDVSGDQVVASTVKHEVHHVAVDRKRDALVEILKQHGEPQALVFCKTKRGANRVGEDLERRGVRAGIIHGNKSQNARNRALEDFKAGRVQVLVATDIAARGLDIVALPLVVNFDLPLVAEDYVHRVGRTGRAGQQGRAVSLVSAVDAGLLQAIQKLVAAPLQHVSTPVIASVDARRPQSEPRPHHRPNRGPRSGAPKRMWPASGRPHHRSNHSKRRNARGSTSA